jgi:hypothetical protein
LLGDGPTIVGLGNQPEDIRAGLPEVCVLLPALSLFVLPSEARRKGESSNDPVEATVPISWGWSWQTGIYMFSINPALDAQVPSPAGSHIAARRLENTSFAGILLAQSVLACRTQFERNVSDPERADH